MYPETQKFEQTGSKSLQMTVKKPQNQGALFDCLFDQVHKGC